MNNYIFAQSANAGLSVTTPNLRFWIDAVHDKKMEPWSSVTPMIYERMMNSDDFIKPDYIINTHMHSDHYSEKLNRKVAAIWPQCKIILPGASLYENTSISFIKTRHEGRAYMSIEHYAIMIRDDEVSVLFAGDTEMGCSSLYEQGAISIAVFPFSWITKSVGRKYLAEHFRESVIILNHLPFEQDDTEGYREATRKCMKLMPQEMDIRLMLEPLQRESIQII